MRWIKLLLLAGIAAAAIGWFITAPKVVDASDFAGLSGDTARGALVFHASGCASCHTAPGADSSDTPELGGGQRFPSPFGTFVAPNISPDPEYGIGTWSTLDLANAMVKGVSPKGQHYYPAFPYASYARAEPQDIVDLKAFLETLPPVAQASAPHEVGFPFNIRRSLGVWKLLFVNDGWVVPVLPGPQERGRYLVEALGHCSECHTPRNQLGGLQLDNWLGGAPDPSGKGKVPDISPTGLDWSEADIAYYLETGFTPEFDSVGGHMTHVVENMARLPKSDRDAIAAYLKALPVD